jgi:hypothetical protein
MEQHRIRRVSVLRDGKLAGIASSSSTASTRQKTCSASKTAVWRLCATENRGPASTGHREGAWARLVGNFSGYTTNAHRVKVYNSIGGADLMCRPLAEGVELGKISSVD